MYETPSRGFGRTFLTLLAFSLALVAAVLFPLWKAIFLGLVLAGALGDWQERLTRRLGKKRRTAAVILIVGVIVAVLIPVGAIVAIVVKEALAATQTISGLVQSEGVHGLVTLVPSPLRPWVEKVIADEPDWARQLMAKLPSQGLAVAHGIAGVLSATGALAFQIAMMLIALYFLLVDGPRLSAWVNEVSPLGPRDTRELLGALRSTARSMLFSMELTAAAQSVLALIGYTIAHAPRPLFFAAITFFASFIPSVGTTLVTLPLALYLLLTGHWIAGVFLAAWGLLVVGTIDNVLKPLFAKEGSHLHGALVFFSMIGGIGFFGPLGLIIGPVALSGFRALVELGWRELGTGKPEVAVEGEALPGGPAEH